KLRRAATVHPETLVEGQRPAGLLVDEIPQVLADTGLAASRLEAGLRFVLRRAIGPDRVRDLALQRRDPARQVGREAEEQIGCGLGIRQRTVVLGQVDPEEPGQRVELVVLEIRVALASEGEGIDEPALVDARRA